LTHLLLVTLTFDIVTLNQYPDNYQVYVDIKMSLGFRVCFDVGEQVA